MKLHYSILPIAQEEFDEGVERYAKQKKGLGRRFAAEVTKVLRLLRKLPKLHAVVFKDVRRAVVKDFPYVILYRVTEEELVILSIFHTSQDPNKWQSRV